MLSKSEEIQILTAAADSLGSGSYCGDWLREQIPFIECDIRSDFHPGIYASASIKDCSARCREMLSEAKAESDRIIASARKEADQIRSKANQFDDQIRAELGRSIQAILNRL